MPADPPLSGTELIEAEATLSKSFKALNKLLDTAMKHKRIADRARNQRSFRLRNPIIPAKICNSGVVKNGNHGLVKLPTEVKNMIFKALPLMADRACLALTCKDLACVYEQLKTETNKKHYDQKVPKRATDVHRLQLLVRLKVDMAPNYRLCYLCLQFIDMSNPINEGQWGGSEVRVRGLKATKAAMIDGPRCPLCVTAKKLEAVNYKEAFKKYVTLTDKISFE